MPFCNERERENGEYDTHTSFTKVVDLALECARLPPLPYALLIGKACLWLFAKYLEVVLCHLVS